MARFTSTFTEKVAVGGYCLYMFVVYMFNHARMVRTAIQKNDLDSLDNHRLPEFGAALSALALVGVLTGRRPLYVFTVFFTIMQALFNTFSLSTILYVLLCAGRSVSCPRDAFAHWNADTVERCYWADVIKVAAELAAFFISSLLCGATVTRGLFDDREILGEAPANGNPRPAVVANDALAANPAGAILREASK